MTSGRAPFCYPARIRWRARLTGTPGLRAPSPVHIRHRSASPGTDLAAGCGQGRAGGRGQGMTPRRVPHVPAPGYEGRAARRHGGPAVASAPPRAAFDPQSTCAGPGSRPTRNRCPRMTAAPTHGAPPRIAMMAQAVMPATPLRPRPPMTRAGSRHASIVVASASVVKTQAATPGLSVSLWAPLIRAASRPTPRLRTRDGLMVKAQTATRGMSLSMPPPMARAASRPASISRARGGFPAEAQAVTRGMPLSWGPFLTCLAIHQAAAAPARAGIAEAARAATPRIPLSISPPATRIAPRMEAGGEGGGRCPLPGHAAGSAIPPDAGHGPFAAWAVLPPFSETKR